MNNRIYIFFLAIGIVLASAPFGAQSAQITPKPNPGIITVNTPTATNSLTPFSDNGVINITGTGTLNNSPGGLTNSGTLINNSNTVSGTGAASPTNSGRLINSGNASLLLLAAGLAALVARRRNPRVIPSGMPH